MVFVLVVSKMKMYIQAIVIKINYYGTIHVIPYFIRTKDFLLLVLLYDYDPPSNSSKTIVIQFSAITGTFRY